MKKVLAGTTAEDISRAGGRLEVDAGEWAYHIMFEKVGTIRAQVLDPEDMVTPEPTRPMREEEPEEGGFEPLLPEGDEEDVDLPDIFGDDQSFDFGDMGDELSIDAMGESEFEDLPDDFE